MNHPKKFDGVVNSFNLAFGLSTTKEDLEGLKAILEGLQKKLEQELTMLSLLDSEVKK